MIRSLALRDAAAPLWEASLEHPFVQGIGDGTLDERAFQWYIRQDYLFLIDYGRLLSLGAARAPRLSWMRRFAALSLAVLETEMELHRGFAARWGVDDLDATVLEPATAAYCDFLLRTASVGDFCELAAAVAPCMWGYAEIGTSLGGARLRRTATASGSTCTRATSSASSPTGPASCWTRSTGTRR